MDRCETSRWKAHAMSSGLLRKTSLVHNLLLTIAGSQSLVHNRWFTIAGSQSLAPSIASQLCSTLWHTVKPNHHSDASVLDRWCKQGLVYNRAYIRKAAWHICGLAVSLDRLSSELGSCLKYPSDVTCVHGVSSLCPPEGIARKIIHNNGTAPRTHWNRPMSYS